MLIQTTIPREEIFRCLLCNDAKCTQSCPKGLDPASILRSIRFDNMVGAAHKLGPDFPCSECDAPCQKACVLTSNPIQIKRSLTSLENDSHSWDEIDEKDVDLSIDFLGVHFENPFLLSSSVVASTYEKISRAFDMGWAGACFKTLCAFIPREASPRYSALSVEHGFCGFKNIEQLSSSGLENDLETIKRLKKDYPEKVIIASIMGRNEDEWQMLAHRAEEAGADIIECNFSCPNMEEGGLGVDIGQSEEAVKKCTKAARKGCSIPLLAKLTPNVASMRPFARAAIESGADGIAAINTIKSLMGMNLDTYATEPSVKGMSGVGGYSGHAVKPIALRFIWELASDEMTKDIQISAMGGIDTWRDAVEFMLLGANHVQITTSVMQYGARIIDDLIDGLKWYMREKAFSSLKELIGLGKDNVRDLDELNRETKLLPRFKRDKCVGCERCVLSCRDGGHEALRMIKGKIVMDPRLCVGCHLCVLVCPMDAVSPYGKRIEL